MGKKKKNKQEASKEGASKNSVKIILKNRKARFNYEILEDYEAGLELVGTEVKSIRQGKVSIDEAFARFFKDELYIIGMHVKPYEFGNQFNHDPLRKRKLLLQKRELNKIAIKVQEKGLTIVPLSLYIKNGWVKIQIGIGKGKKLYDKRETKKKKEMEMELKRTVKDFNQ